jgi:hypothetical protein
MSVGFVLFMIKGGFIIEQELSEPQQLRNLSRTHFSTQGQSICQDPKGHVSLDLWTFITLTITVPLTEKFGLAKIKDMLKDIINNCYDLALERQKTEGYIVFERGLATVPLAGIDVPFHSRYLWSGVMPFCACECTFAFLSLSI